MGMHSMAEVGRLAAAVAGTGGAYEPQQRSFPASSSAAAAALAAEVLPPPQPAKSPWRTTPSPSL